MKIKVTPAEAAFIDAYRKSVFEKGKGNGGSIKNDEKVMVDLSPAELNTIYNLRRERKIMEENDEEELAVKYYMDNYDGKYIFVYDHQVHLYDGEYSGRVFQIKFDEKKLKASIHATKSMDIPLTHADIYDIDIIKHPSEDKVSEFVKYDNKFVIPVLPKAGIYNPYMKMNFPHGSDIATKECPLKYVKIITEEEYNEVVRLWKIKTKYEDGLYEVYSTLDKLLKK